MQLNQSRAHEVLSQNAANGWHGWEEGLVRTRAFGVNYCRVSTRLTFGESHEVTRQQSETG